MVEAAAQAATGRTFSRQSLAGHKAIKKAYDDRVVAYRKAQDTGKSEDPGAVEEPNARRSRLLKEENASLKELVAEYDRRWQVLAAEAQLRGLDVRNLATTLRKVHRDGKDKDKKANGRS